MGATWAERENRSGARRWGRVRSLIAPRSVNIEWMSSGLASFIYFLRLLGGIVWAIDMCSRSRPLSRAVKHISTAQFARPQWEYPKTQDKGLLLRKICKWLAASACLPRKWHPKSKKKKCLHRFWTRVALAGEWKILSNLIGSRFGATAERTSVL